MDDKNIELFIPHRAYQKLMWYVRAVDTEITGFAEVIFDEERKRLVVGEVYLLDQEAAGSEVEMSEEAIAKFTDQMMEQGATQLPRLWWHSHVDMGAFFSTTDDIAMDDLNNGTWGVALVMNKREEMKASVNIYYPIRHTFDDVDITYEVPPLTIPKEIQDEVAAKVKEMKLPELPALTGKGHGYSGIDYEEMRKRRLRIPGIHMKNGQFHYKNHNIMTCKKYADKCKPCNTYFELIRDDVMEEIGGDGGPYQN